MLADDSLFSYHQQSLWKFFLPCRSLLSTPKSSTDCQKNPIRNTFTQIASFSYILRLAPSFNCFSVYLMCNFLWFGCLPIVFDEKELDAPTVDEP